MRAGDETVAAFYRDDRLEHHRRCGIGGWDQRGDDPHRLADLDDLFLLVLANNADGSQILDRFIHSPRGKFILFFLVFRFAKTGLFVGHCSEPFGLRAARIRHRLHNFIDLFLGIRAEGELRFFRLSQKFPDFLDGLQILIKRHDGPFLELAPARRPNRPMIARSPCSSLYLSDSP